MEGKNYGRGGTGGGSSGRGRGGGGAGRGRGRGRSSGGDDQSYGGRRGRGRGTHMGGGYDSRFPGGGESDRSYRGQYDQRQGDSGGRGAWGRGAHEGGYAPAVSGGGSEMDQRYRGQYPQLEGGRGARGPGTQVAGGVGGGEFIQKLQQPSGGGVGPSGRGAWTGRPWGPSASSSSAPAQYQPRPQHPQPTPALSDVQSLRISEEKPLSAEGKPDNKLLPIKRPDRGILAVRTVKLLANHFPVKFNSEGIITHYDVDIQQVMPGGNQPHRRSIPKALLSLIKDKLFSDEGFPVDMVTYDGEKNIFSAVSLPTGEFKVELSDGEENVRTYKFVIQKVNQLKLSNLKDYLCGNLPHIPRDILQAMDLVMKHNPSMHRIPVGRSFFSKNERGDDLGHGIAAYRGFYQSLKPTSNGLALCLDYSVLAFRKPLPVIDFLKENVEGFRGVNDVMRMRRQVESALKGLKVRVTHRKTKQKYTISGLTRDITRLIKFSLVDPDGQVPPREVSLVDYFRQKYEEKIAHLDIPCLDLGRKDKKNDVPMEFCVLVEGQRYSKEYLERNEKDAAVLLKQISLAPPAVRKRTICDMVQAEDGPDGIVAKGFNMQLEKCMTSVGGRVLGAPELKLGGKNGNVYPVRVDQEKCQWNLVDKCVVQGKPVERWALIDFTSSSRYRLRKEDFIGNLIQRARRLGMHMQEPLVCHSTGMDEFYSVDRIDALLRKVIADARPRSGSQGTLQIIVCVMAGKDPGYKYLKWVSETRIGVVTQCCLCSQANRGQDQYLANLCLKINAKLGGSNVELNDRLPNFADQDYVMFIGADVNHPAARNSTCPSIAAVVGTINWPAANRYAARVQPQEHRKEKIVNFGSICRDLVSTYAKLNKIRPKRIVVFRDGVSEGQFDMVLNEELLDLKRAICDENYQPTITLVVAQKRHHTRLFLEGGRDNRVGNVPPGTVVDTTIVHPFEFDFYLCSHYGTLGTSKPTHYYVLWDENAFTSDRLHQLIYNMCFTYARCTKPVSLVPPVYYADLVAYRGRMFQEVVMEQPPASSPSSSSATPSVSLSSSASFDHNFYTLHPDLQNVMFFV
ncbi:protein argonaute 2-like [Coffea arabica]|uniref:Protein argonaute 2-like n=1 Tax=Coffea arabica TaxID=13443 RepID=A0ABM4VR00_COFAR